MFWKNYQVIVIIHASSLTVNENYLEVKEEGIALELFLDEKNANL